MRNSLLLLTFLAASGTAVAEPVDPSTAPSSPVRDQLEVDLTPIPAGLGAIFVPAVEGKGDGTPVFVLSEGVEIAAGHVGERLIVPAGQYRVEIGDGPPSGRAAVDARRMHKKVNHTAANCVMSVFSVVRRVALAP